MRHGIELTSRAGRAWVRAYTFPLPPEWRARRRAEIAADLWDQAAEDATAAAVGARLARGAFDDLAWALSTCVSTAHPTRNIRSVAALAVLLLPSLWLIAVMGHRRGGLIEAVATRAYWLFFIAGLAALAAGTWWFANKILETLTRRSG